MLKFHLFSSKNVVELKYTSQKLCQTFTFTTDVAKYIVVNFKTLLFGIYS